MASDSKPASIGHSLWFRAKRYGWGWYPATWQGWVVLAVYGLLDGAAFFVIKNAAAFVATIVGLSMVLLLVTYKTGEKPHWRWGGSLHH